MQTNIKNISYCAIFAALTAILSQIAIPMVPVPINLAMLSVFVAGALLGPTKATASQVVYILLGAIGVPVFSGFSGGFGVIVGPTGGYIVGYVASAFVIGIIVKYTKKSIISSIFAMVVGLIVCYALGTAWFMYGPSSEFVGGLWLAITYCVIPFLIGDMLKIILASFLVNRLRKVIKL